jgi:hypothetical protein
MDKGSGSRIFGWLILAGSGLIALINFSAIGQIPGSSVLNIGYLFNIFIFALPLAILGFIFLMIGRSKGRDDADSEYAKKAKQIRPLL